MDTHRLLSSDRTLFQKYFFSIFGLLIGLPMAAVSWWAGLLPLWFLAPVVFFLAIKWITLVPLRQVELKDGILKISDFSREALVKLEDVGEVGVSSSPPIIVTLHLKRQTVFGEKIRFAPKEKYFSSANDAHPLIAQIRQMVDRAKEKDRKNRENKGRTPGLPGK